MSYATLKKYQPYIDMIRRDLGIPDSYFVDVRFTKLFTKGGYARTHSIVIDKTGGHYWTVQALMHEFRHIWQRHTQRYVDIWRNEKQYVLWDGGEYQFYNIALAKRAGDNTLYLDRPWEIDARAYEKEIERLFPNGQLKRTFVGLSSDGTKLYKL